MPGEGVCGLAVVAVISGGEGEGDPLAGAGVGGAVLGDRFLLSSVFVLRGPWWVFAVSRFCGRGYPPPVDDVTAVR